MLGVSGNGSLSCLSLPLLLQRLQEGHRGLAPSWCHRGRGAGGLSVPAVTAACSSTEPARP